MMDSEVIVGLFTLGGTLLGFLTNYGIERLRAKNDNRLHISSVNYDIKIKAYKDLSDAFYKMLTDVYSIIPSGVIQLPHFDLSATSEKKAYEQGLYERANVSHQTALTTLYSNVPFIPKEHYEKYNAIVGMAHKQIFLYGNRFNTVDLLSYEKKSILKPEDYDRTAEMIRLFEELNKELREYINNIEVDKNEKTGSTANR